MKEERSDRRHRSGDILQPTGKEGVSTGYDGSGGYGGSVGKIGHARSGRRSQKRLIRLGMLEVEDEVRRG